MMRSETVTDKADYEEHHVELTQLLAYLKAEYQKSEKEVGIPMKDFL